MSKAFATFEPSPAEVERARIRTAKRRRSVLVSLASTVIFAVAAGFGLVSTPGWNRVAPPLMNDFVSLQKDVGLISILGAVDAVRAAQIEVAKSANFTPYVVAGLLFVLLAIPSVRFADHIASKYAKREQAGSAL